MKRYPSVREAKVLARVLSNSIGIKLTHAQQIMAFRFDCRDWSELLGKADSSPSDDERFTHDWSFYGLVNQDDVELLKERVSPHLPAFTSMMDDSIYVKDSHLRKITEGRLSELDGDSLSWILHSEDSTDWDDPESIAYHINCHDSTVTQAVTDIGKIAKRGYSNIWIESWLHATKIYSYYYFDGKQVQIIVREWDLHVSKPTKNKTILSNDGDVTQCRWYIKFMTGFLKHLIGQFKELGYDGKVRVCCVDNINAQYLHYGTKPNRTYNKGVGELYQELMSMGGKLAFDTNENGHFYNIGIELPFGSEGCYL